jgi:hypothetical protein
MYCILRGNESGRRSLNVKDTYHTAYLFVIQHCSAAPDVRSLDPRGLKSYTDLDAPAEGEVALDYD